VHIGDDLDELSEEEEFAKRAHASFNSKLEQWDAPSAAHQDDDHFSYDILEAQRAALETMSGKFLASSRKGDEAAAGEGGGLQQQAPGGKATRFSGVKVGFGLIIQPFSMQ
jgi:hypothetical protein